MSKPPIPPLRQSAPAGNAYRVLYDADCGFCSRSVAWLARRRSSVAREWVPMASEEGRRLAPDRPVDEMGLVGPGGEVWFGGDAWIVCLSTLTYWRWAAWVMSFAPAHQIVRLVYPLVAKNRQKLSRLLGTSCQIK